MLRRWCLLVVLALCAASSALADGGGSCPAAQSAVVPAHATARARHDAPFVAPASAGTDGGLQPAAAAPLTVRIVTKAFVRTADELVGIGLDAGREVRATLGHPFQVDGVGWVAAGELVEGDRVRLAGSVAAVTALRLVPGRVAVHNLEVGDTHTYFVSDAASSEPVWVHNRCVLRSRWDDGEVGAGPGGVVSNCPVFQQWRERRLSDPVFAAMSEADQFLEFQTHALRTRVSLTVAAGARLFSSGAQLVYLRGTSALRTSMASVGLHPPVGILTETHHLFPRAAVQAVERLFKDPVLVIKQGQSINVSIPIDLDHWSNGVFLPKANMAQKVLGFIVARHSGYHPAYSKAMERIFMAEKIRLDIVVAKAVTPDEVRALVDKTSGRLGLLQRRAHELLMTRPPDTAISMYVKDHGGNIDTDELSEIWLKQLGYEGIP